MEPDTASLHELVRKTLEVSEENNKMLKAMRRDKWIGFIVNILFWAAVFIASYYFTMQVFGPLLSSFGGAEGMEEIMKQYQGLLNQQ